MEELSVMRVDRRFKDIRQLRTQKAATDQEDAQQQAIFLGTFLENGGYGAASQGGALVYRC